MKAVLIVATAAILAAQAWCSDPEYVFEGKWGVFGIGPGQFNEPEGVALAANGYIYVGELAGNRVQCFSAPDVYLRQWPCATAYGLAVGPTNRYLYVTNFSAGQVLYYTSVGSLVGSWGGMFLYTGGIECAADGNVYVADLGNDCIRYFTPAGSELGSFGYGYLDMPVGLEIAPNGNVYAVGHLNNLVAYFTSTGSFLGSWDSMNPGDISMSRPDNIYFVSYLGGDLVYYYTSTGSLIGSFGGPGTGNGEFDNPGGIAVTADGTRVYVTDRDNHRVQYFKFANPAVLPASLGRVKALFR